MFFQDASSGVCRTVGVGNARALPTPAPLEGPPDAISGAVPAGGQPATPALPLDSGHRKPPMPAKPGALLENQPLSCLFKISPGLKSLRCAVCRVLCCLVSTHAGGPAVEPSLRFCGSAGGGPGLHRPPDWVPAQTAGHPAGHSTHIVGVVLPEPVTPVFVVWLLVQKPLMLETEWRREALPLPSNSPGRESCFILS